MVPGMGNFSYEDRLERLGLFSLERRRLSGDLIEMFKVMRMLERVQERVTGMVPGMRNFSDEDRLERLGLFPLERRRLRGDLIEMFKIARGLDGVEREKLFPLVKGSRMRGHRLKVICKRSKCDVRKIIFTQRVVGVWNAQPGSVVEAGSI